MPTFCNRLGNRGTSLVYDGDVAAREDATNANARIANVSNQVSALLDLNGRLVRGAEQSTGNLTINKVYEITATTADYFGTGLIVGNLFVASSALALSSSNKVKEVVGNHLVQTNTSYMPIFESGASCAIFDGINDYLKALPFTLNQPTSIYVVVKQISWTNGDRLLDGNINNSLGVLQNVPAGAITAYAGTAFTNTTKSTIGTFDIISIRFVGASSSIKINNLNNITGNAGTVNAGGLTLGARGDITFFGNISVKELLIRRVADSDLMQSAIMNYLYYKHNITY